MATSGRTHSSRSMTTPLHVLTRAVALGAVAALALSAQQAPPAAATRAPAKKWVLPRTPDGHPDFQGNWSNATLTPIQRPPGQERALTKAQVAAIEKIRSDTIEKLSKDSDPNRPAPPVGGDGSTGAAGMVGGYNYFYIDAGDHMALVNGETRSSIVVDPPDGRVPAFTPAARTRMLERGRAMRGMGEYDNPENRPLAERCLMSFGSNAGPPMLPNYFYNNNYTIVQTRDHIVMMTEMVHDARIIRMNATTRLPANVRPWMGESIGRWEGDTLVIATTNFHPRQLFYGGSSDSLTVTERFHRTGEHTLLYRFTISDASMFTKAWSGELPYNRMDDLIYEYACHEANYALSNILSGERSREREAAAKPKP